MQVARVTWRDGLRFVCGVALALCFGFLRPRLLRDNQIRVWRKDGWRHDCVMGYEKRLPWEILHERKDWMKNIFRRQPCWIIVLPSKPCLKTEMHQTLPSYADDYKFRAILQKTMPFELNILWQTVVFHSKGTFISAQLTFNAFPEVIAVSSYRGEFAQVVVRAPDVHVFILRAAHDEWIIMTRRAGNKSRLQKWALIHISEDTSTIQMVFHFQAHCIYKWACLHDSTHARYKSN